MTLVPLIPVPSLFIKQSILQALPQSGLWVSFLAGNSITALDHFSEH